MKKLIVKKLAVVAVIAGMSGWAQAVNVTNILANGDFVVQFGDVGSFSWTVPDGVTRAQVLVVGGGGAGGGACAGGGGGGGQVIYKTVDLTPGTEISVEVGAGGIRPGSGSGAQGGSGGRSLFDTFVAPGGGGGGGNSAVSGVEGANGGGHASQSAGEGAEGSSGINDPENGYYGGHKGGDAKNRNNWASGGGGGAMTDGAAGGLEKWIGGNGGDGFLCRITGDEIAYGCGGGGGLNCNDGSGTPGLGGSGGISGGNATALNGEDGRANTGTGGGGATYRNANGLAGNGGSGFVAIRYASPTPIATVAGFEGMLDGETHGVKVDVVYPTSGAAVLYKVDAGDWTADAPTFDSVCRHTVAVKVSADGLQDYETSVAIHLVNEPLVKDGSVVLVCPPGTAGNEPTAPYDTWATAANDLNDAITEAGKFSGYGTVLVKPGTYALSASVTKSTFKLLRSYDPETGGIAPATTVLDGQQTVRCMAILPYSGKPVVRGLKFYRGEATGSYGGGVDVWGESGTGIPTKAGDAPSFVDCIFESCHAAQEGGAFHARGRTYLENCTFRNNAATRSDYGGTLEVLGLSGAHANGTATAIVGCTFDESADCTVSLALQGFPYLVSNCTFRTKGATTIAFYNDWVTADNTLITYSRALGARGPLVASSSSAASHKGVTIRNCLVANSASRGLDTPSLATGGAETVVENCTITGCTKAGINVEGGTAENPNRLRVVNSIIWGNNTTWQDVNVKANAAYEEVTSSTGYGEPNGNNTTDPKFRDAANGDYSLRRSSPHRDAGTKLGWMTADAVDLAGDPRVVTDGRTLAENPDAIPDLGCYENQEAPRGLLMIVR